MFKISPLILGLSTLIVGGSFAQAQNAAPSSIPLVLQIQREYIKPYKSGAAHDKTESAIAAAFAKAKFPAYYVGLNSLSGKSRGLYLTQYASFADWEKANKIMDKNPTLGAEVDRTSQADGENLEELDSVVYTYDADFSYHPHADISHARYMEITIFHVKKGHYGDWRELTKMVKDANEKGGTSSHWATFDIAYGAENDTYISLSADNSMTDIDTGFSESKKFMAGMGGEEGMKKFDELYGKTIESMRTELFSINPRQSYVNPEWIASDPDFWKPKAAMAAKAAAKPADAAKP
jgi:hypothetical protein